MTHSFRQQRTIAEPAMVEGFGYWSGQDVRLEFHPAAPDHGVVFVRSDVDNAPTIAAHVENRWEVPRRTNLVADGTSVEMVEHVMASLAGLRIDNCEVRVNRTEVPGCDGSSLMMVEALDRVGQLEQPERRSVLAVATPLRVADSQGWVEAYPSRSQDLRIEYVLDYGPGPIGKQAISMRITPDLFRTDIAPARTFILQQEAEWLRSQGLGLRVTCRDLLVFDQQGPVDNPLRYPNECVRHKALDLIGDLALAGCDIHGRIVAYRSGHRLNAELVRRLLVENQIHAEGRSRRVA